MLLFQVKEKLELLQKQYDEKLAQKEELKNKAELLELQLDRAAKLVSGLASERVRWEESVKVQLHRILHVHVLYVYILRNPLLK